MTRFGEQHLPTDMISKVSTRLNRRRETIQQNGTHPPPKLTGRGGAYLSKGAKMPTTAIVSENNLSKKATTSGIPRCKDMHMLATPTPAETTHFFSGVLCLYPPHIWFVRLLIPPIFEIRCLTVTVIQNISELHARR